MLELYGFRIIQYPGYWSWKSDYAKFVFSFVLHYFNFHQPKHALGSRNFRPETSHRVKQLMFKIRAKNLFSKQS
jgi:hypothetical protein